MRLQEAKILKIDDIVFVIGRDRNVYKKIVIGTRLMNNKSIDVTYIDSAEKNAAKAIGFLLPHDEVFLKEKEALEYVLLAHEAQINSIEIKMRKLESQLGNLR